MSLTNAEKNNRSNRLGQSFALKRKYLAIPYALFLVLFVIIPLLLIVGYAFTKTTYDEYGTKITSFSFDAIAGFFTNAAKWSVLFVSLFVGIQTTLICLVLAYPAAYFLAEKKFNVNKVLVILFIMWENVKSSGAIKPWIVVLLSLEVAAALGFGGYFFVRTTRSKRLRKRRREERQMNPLENKTPDNPTKPLA